MPLRLNRKQLSDLVEEIEANGGNAAELRHELEALEPEAKHTPPTRRNSRFKDEEETTEERLNRRVGDLFPNNIPFKEIYDYDYRFRQEELIEQCRKAGLGLSGDKKEMAAKLIAHNQSFADETSFLGEGI